MIGENFRLEGTMFVGLTALVLVLTASVAAAGDLTGRASIIDGDTLEIHGTRVRLSGIDAPESSQLCRDAESNLYQCGARAANELFAFIADRPVACTTVDRDRYGRMVARCSVNSVDLGDWLVRGGLALDWPRSSKGLYADAQHVAEGAERGIWAGSFVEPWRFRACVRLGGRSAVCSDEAGGGTE